MNMLIRYFTKQATLVNLITVFVFVFGAFSIYKLQREVFPNIAFDVVTVRTAFPGGSAESIERLITNPLEQDLKEVDGVKKMNSTSVEGQSVIVLQLDPDEVDAEETEAKIEDVVDAFTSLPEGAENPVVTLLESKYRPIIQVTLSGEVAEEVLREAAKKLEVKIETIAEVAKVDIKGKRDREIVVEADPDKLRRLRISLPQMVAALRENNFNIPGGVLEPSDGESFERIIRTDGEIRNVRDIEDTVIRANLYGKSIRIKDVATIREGFAEAEILYATNGKKSIYLRVLKKQGADAIRLVDQVKTLVEASRGAIAPGIELSYVNDSSYLVRRRIKVLGSNLLVGLLLVVLILSLFLPARIAGVTAFGIPFSFLGAVGIFYLLGISINLISLMGLIIVVGMLVDDAVVVTENVHSFIESGKSAEEGAVLGAQQIWRPVVASVMTTVIAFAPMMYMPGIFGKFVRYIPMGVIICLMVSLVECFFVLPHHIAEWGVSRRRPQGVRQPRGVKASILKFWERMAIPGYRWLLGKLLSVRYLVITAALALMLGSFYFAKHKMSFILFPPGAIDTFVIKMEAKVGTPVTQMREWVRPLEQVLAKVPEGEVLDFVTTVGWQGEQNRPGSKRGGENAQITVYLSPETDRQRSALEIIEDVKQRVGETPNFEKVVFQRKQGGPPVGKPVSVGVRGQEYADILQGVQAVREELSKMDGVSDLADTYVQGKDEIKIRTLQDKAAAAQLSLRNVALAIRSVYEGLVATRITTLDEEIDVRVTMASDHRMSLKSLEELEIPNQRGQLIPLKKVAEWTQVPGVAAYDHENNQRQVEVTGEIDTAKTSSRAVNQRMQALTDSWQQRFPRLTFHYGGEGQDTQESLAGLLQAFGFAFFGILLMLILLFGNVYQPVLVATTIPMGIVGVIWTFYWHGQPLSFLATVGIIALSGVIVNNAIVLVDFFNHAKGQFPTVKDALLDAAGRRVRPIFLTTITTVAGILPTAYGIGGLDPFVVPIALSLGWGMLCGSLLTLLLFPSVLLVAEDVLSLLRWLRGKVGLADGDVRRSSGVDGSE
ncbi:MAG: efflux RND transporter permease subunit [Zetaproteobacteria bacterium]|nr:efflux RND transporter permease subunit [Zetaproteobacteria bacterium]